MCVEIAIRSLVVDQITLELYFRGQKCNFIYNYSYQQSHKKIWFLLKIISEKLQFKMDKFSSLRFN